MRARRTKRGFSLLELLISVVIGGLSVAVAADLAGWGARQAGKGTEQNALSSRMRMMRNQIRADLEVAGLGSTGAVAASCGDAFFSSLCVATAGGRQAIPVARGSNNIATAAFGGLDIMDDSDAMQVVAPDPGSVLQTNQLSTAGTLNLPALGVPLNCAAAGVAALIYIADHSAPNGSGRTQLAVASNTAAAGSIALAAGNTLQFPVAEGSDVMCARISTYWLDTDGGFHRTDNIPGGDALTALGGLQVQPAAVVNSDLITPGVVELQIAYGLSSETPGTTRTDPTTAWAFDGTNATLDTNLGATPRNWFEVRQVRMSFLMRTLRPIDSIAAGDTRFDIQEAAIEDAPAPKAIPIQFGRHRLQTGAVLTNLRYFDYNGALGLRAEPY